MTLDTADLISVDGTAFDPAKTALDKVAAESEFQAVRGQAVEMKTKYGASTWMWFGEPRDVRTRLTFTADNKKETKTILDIPAAPGQDYFYLVYPRRDGDPAPGAKALAPGVMSVKTPESADTIFLGDTAFGWETPKDDIVFTGKAGAVRVFADRVALCLSAGSGTIGYKGCVFEGPGPFERVVMLKDLKPGTQKIEGGYEKKVVTADLGKGVKVTGEGPLTATLDGEVVRIKVSGRARVVRVTQPPFIVRPQYFVDGQQWMASWTDYPASGWGMYDNSWLIGLSVPAGDHELVVKDLEFEKVWARPFTPLVAGAVVEVKK
jgi:hypothetical protein